MSRYFRMRPTQKSNFVEVDTYMFEDHPPPQADSPPARRERNAPAYTDPLKSELVAALERAMSIKEKKQQIQQDHWGASLQRATSVRENQAQKEVPVFQRSRSNRESHHMPDQSHSCHDKENAALRLAVQKALSVREGRNGYGYGYGHGHGHDYGSRIAAEARDAFDPRNASLFEADTKLHCHHGQMNTQMEDAAKAIAEETDSGFWWKKKKPTSLQRAQSLRYNRIASEGEGYAPPRTSFYSKGGDQGYLPSQAGAIGYPAVIISRTYPTKDGEAACLECASCGRGLGVIMHGVPLGERSVKPCEACHQPQTSSQPKPKKKNGFVKSVRKILHL